MKRNITIMLMAALLMTSVWAVAGTVTFDSSAVISAIGGLNNPTNQWGLWDVRARPIVTGGTYTITGASTTQTGWGTDAPSSYAWNTYGTNCAWFYDEAGSEAGSTASNPLYMIADVSADKFWSYSFDGSGDWVGDWSPGGGGTWYASGYDSGAGGTNQVTAVNSSSTFSFNFTLGVGATWNGQWEFLVDGSKYSLGTHSSPGAWQEDFWGGYGTSGDLVGNTGTGYVVPEPGSLLILGTGLMGLVGLATRKRR